VSKEAKPDAWMPLYIGDWDGDTGHLDCEQDGAYGRLVRYYWRNGPLSDDDESLTRIVRMQLSRWRRVRPILAAFFTIADGRWNHKRVDAELVRWSDKKVRAVERAKRGAAARWDATSNATSIPDPMLVAMLEQCPSSSSREVRAHSGALTLSEGQNDFLGPKEVRDAFKALLGDDWCRSYLDPCVWQDVPERALVPATRSAGKKLCGDGRPVLAKLGLTVLERAA
jgi:uncharacterized protein YdaU (DUF1376 family)